VNNRFFTVAMGVALASCSFVTTAKDFMASYDGFYDRMKVVNKGEYTQAKVGFYLADMTSGDKCELSKGEIITEKQAFPLNYSEEMELLLPFDVKLDKDKAMVVAKTINPKHECQLIMQIEAPSDNRNSFSKAHLYNTYTEFDDLIDDLSGFVLSTVFGFLMPDTLGVTLIFDQPVQLLSQNQDDIKCTDSRCTITMNSGWKSNSESVNFSIAPTKIIPYIEK